MIIDDIKELTFASSLAIPRCKDVEDLLDRAHVLDKIRKAKLKTETDDTDSSPKTPAQTNPNTAANQSETPRSPQPKRRFPNNSLPPPFNPLKDDPATRTCY